MYLTTVSCAVCLSLSTASAMDGRDGSMSGDDWESVKSRLPEYVAAGIDSEKGISLTEEEKECLAFLYGAMPLPDMTGYPFRYWVDNVRKTLEVRKNAAWEIPEREFRHFVLPLRVNNEALDNFRTIYADELCARVEGMTLAQAALEINHWCHEMATYAPSDARTLSPTGTIASGLGRCGEESVLDGTAFGTSCSRCRILSSHIRSQDGGWVCLLASRILQCGGGHGDRSAPGPETAGGRGRRHR